MPILDGKFLLILQLFDRNTTRFVQARIYNSYDGAEISGSPVNLTHVENGLYKDASLTAPDIAKAIAVYSVYSDDEYEVLDDNYETIEETITIVEPTGGGGTIEDQIIGEVDVENQMLGEVELSFEIEGEI